MALYGMVHCIVSLLLVYAGNRDHTAGAGVHSSAVHAHESCGR
jgi:hypothetical protein